MSKFPCYCGYVISDVTDELPYKAYYVPSEQWPTGRRATFGEVRAYERIMYECTQCGRIWMQVTADANDWVSYQPESSRRGTLSGAGATPDGSFDPKKVEPRTDWKIEPYVSVGPIRLGMAREEIKMLINDARKLTTQRGSQKPGDYFPALGLFVDYRAPGVCEFVELGGPLSPSFQGQTFLGQPQWQAQAWFAWCDPELETDGASLISRRFGVALYSRAAEKAPDWPVESVAIFERGYYDRPTQPEIIEYEELSKRQETLPWKQETLLLTE